MAKSVLTRLNECIQTITNEGGDTDVDHVRWIAERRIPTVRANISLEYTIKIGAPSSNARKLVRAILLMEAVRSTPPNPLVTQMRKNQLCAMNENALRHLLQGMLGQQNEDPNGPIYIPQGGGQFVPLNQPVNWDLRDAEGGQFHYACDLDRQCIVIGPENPRSKVCGVGFSTYMASGHGKRALEMNRHFRLGYAEQNVIAGHNFVPRIIAGFVESFNPLTFNDNSGHFGDNFKALPNNQNEQTFVAIIQVLNRGARFVHFFSQCPLGPVCPGHTTPDTL